MLFAFVYDCGCALRRQLNKCPAARTGRAAGPRAAAGNRPGLSFSLPTVAASLDNSADDQVSGAHHRLTYSLHHPVYGPQHRLGGGWFSVRTRRCPLLRPGAVQQFFGVRNGRVCPCVPVYEPHTFQVFVHESARVAVHAYGPHTQQLSGKSSRQAWGQQQLPCSRSGEPGG
jgi:hypothetical protein